MKDNRQRYTDVFFQCDFFGKNKILTGKGRATNIMAFFAKRKYLSHAN